MVESFTDLHGLRNPEVEHRIHKGSQIIPILSRIHQISHVDTQFFKIYSIIILPSTPRFLEVSFYIVLPFNILKLLLLNELKWTGHLFRMEKEQIPLKILKKMSSGVPDSWETNKRIAECRLNANFGSK